MKSRLNLFLLLILPLLILDQVTKVLARGHLPGKYYTYFGDLFRLHYIENSGAFLGMGSGLSDSFRYGLFTVGVTGVLLWVLWLLVRKKPLDPGTGIALALVFSGGVGNLIDRFMKGTVTDFMNVGIGSLRTGIFNIADMAILAGCFVLFAYSFKKPSSEQK